MKSKFLRVLLAIAATLTFSALPKPAAPPPLATTPAIPAASATTTTAARITGTKVGAINIEGAIFGSNEGRRDLDALQKKFGHPGRPN